MRYRDRGAEEDTAMGLYKRCQHKGSLPRSLRTRVARQLSALGNAAAEDRRDGLRTFDELADHYAEGYVKPAWLADG
jgi:hypothetical protein